MGLGYKILAGVGLVVVLFFTVNWYNGYQQDIGYAKAKSEYDADLVVKLAEARSEEREAAALKDKAIKEGVEREKKLRETIALRESVNDGLRYTLNNLRQRVSGETGEACRGTALTLAAVFEECVGRYSAVAEAADRHASDVQLLLEAP